MKQVPLSQGLFAIVDEEDFEQVSRYKWTAHKTGANIYALRWLRRTYDGQPRKCVFLHHFIMKLHGVEIPEGLDVDHRNGNSLDEQFENLRIATRRKNLQNRRHTSRSKPSSSRYKGVSFEVRKCRKPWSASICVDGVRIGLGSYHFEEDAAMAYNWAALYHFGEFARFNERVS